MEPVRKDRKKALRTRISPGGREAENGDICLINECLS